MLEKHKNRDKKGGIHKTVTCKAEYTAVHVLVYLNKL